MNVSWFQSSVACTPYIHDHFTSFPRELPSSAALESQALAISLRTYVVIHIRLPWSKIEVIGAMAIPRSIPNCSKACSNCRQRKVRCNGDAPCANCVSKGEECFYPASRRGQGNHNKSRVKTSLRDRLAKLETLLQTSNHDQVTPLADSRLEASKYVEQDSPSELPPFHDPPKNRNEARQFLPLSPVAPRDSHSQGHGFGSGCLKPTIIQSPNHSIPSCQLNVEARGFSTASTVSPVQDNNADTAEPVNHQADPNVASKTRIVEYHGETSFFKSSPYPLEL